MPGKSSIATLPAQVLERLNFLIGEGALTVDELTDWLDEQGHPRSRSAVGRHRKKIEDVARRLRESREITDALVAELGEASAQGKQGRLLVEMARGLVFDLITKLQDFDEDTGPAIDSKDVAMLGKGLAELGRALRFDQDFETKVRQQVVDEIGKQLEGAVAEAAAAGEKGLSAERVAQLRRDFLGVRE